MKVPSIRRIIYQAAPFVFAIFGAFIMSGLFIVSMLAFKR